MTHDMEKSLRRELQEVADQLRVPPLPVFPASAGRAGGRHRQPLMVAAAVLLIVLGALTTVSLLGGGDGDGRPDPAPPVVTTPTGDPTPAVATIPTGVPTVPYVLGPALFVDATLVPGRWGAVEHGAAAWIAQRLDDTWWWGWDVRPRRISGAHDTPPVLSPGGRYVAATSVVDGEGMVVGFDTAPDGEGLGGLPVDLGSREDGSLVTVRAVTDDGRVVVQGSRTALLWSPLDADSQPVDLQRTAPGRQVVAATAAGLVVTSGESIEPVTDAYFADLSETGELTRTGAVPDHDDLEVSPGGLWLAWTPAGTTGGEVDSTATLEAQRVDGSQRTTLTAPDGWGFQAGSFTWEDDDHLVSTVVRGRTQRLARCGPVASRCVLIPAE